MIRAVYRDGAIQPLDGIPAEWQEGDELVINAVSESIPSQSFEEWAADLNAATEGISEEDHQRFMAALEEVERESKELGRREMEKVDHCFDNDLQPQAAKEAG